MTAQYHTRFNPCRSAFFIGNSQSSFSLNVARVREAVHADPERLQRDPSALGSNDRPLQTILADTLLARPPSGKAREVGDGTSLNDEGTVLKEDASGGPTSTQG